MGGVLKEAGRARPREELDAVSKGATFEGTIVLTRVLAGAVRRDEEVMTGTPVTGIP